FRSENERKPAAPRVFLPRAGAKSSHANIALDNGTRLIHSGTGKTLKAREREEQAMTDHVRSLVAQVPQLAGQEVIGIQEMGGGLTNRNYKLTSTGGTSAVRVFGADTELLGINRQREVACSQAAAAAGVGPDVVAYLPQHRALVCAFVPGELLTVETI